MTAEFAGKVLAVTGAGSGIGHALARGAAAAGAIVAITDIDAAALEATRRDLQVDAREVIALPADVTVAEQVCAFVDRTVARHGRLDALAHCAGVESIGPLAEMSEREWERTIAVNLTGTFICDKYAIRQMLKQQGGVILNTASQFGLVGYPMMGAYSASKGGVVLLTK